MHSPAATMDEMHERHATQIHLRNVFVRMQYAQAFPKSSVNIAEIPPCGIEDSPYILSNPSDTYRYATANSTAQTEEVPEIC